MHKYNNTFLQVCITPIDVQCMIYIYIYIYIYISDELTKSLWSYNGFICCTLKDNDDVILTI